MPSEEEYLRRASAQYRNLTAAAEEGREAVKLAPEDALYHSQLGITLYFLKCYEQAAEEIQTAIRLDPRNALYHCQLSKTLYEMKEYKEAADQQKIAARLAHKMPHALHSTITP